MRKEPKEREVENIDFTFNYRINIIKKIPVNHFMIKKRALVPSLLK